MYSVAWSPDGKRLATASEDGTVQIYPIDVRDLLDLARKRVTRDFTPDECELYLQSKKCPSCREELAWFLHEQLELSELARTEEPQGTEERNFGS